MDPITAFSLACGVIQVIDFSAKVLSQCREIYKNGSLSENESIESMTEHLTTLRADLQPTASSTGAQTAGDKDLIQLSKQCSDMAKELVAEQQPVKAGSIGSRWKAVSVTFRSLKKKSTIERMQRQLDEYRKILDTKVLADLRLVFLFFYLIERESLSLGSGGSRTLNWWSCGRGCTFYVVSYQQHPAWTESLIPGSVSACAPGCRLKYQPARFPR